MILFAFFISFAGKIDKIENHLFFAFFMFLKKNNAGILRQSPLS